MLGRGSGSAPVAGHWNRIFRTTPDQKLGWFEKDPSPTFKLIRRVPGWKKSVVLLTGAGTSVLAGKLRRAGPRLVLNDISGAALNKLRKSLPSSPSPVVWLKQDISRPIARKIPKIDLWIDRAVLHFLTRRKDIDGYFDNLRSHLSADGYVLLAEFSRTGAPKCAGLAVHRYSLEEMSRRLGPGFERVEFFYHKYINPWKEPRPYVYALFRRNPGS